MTHLQSLCGLLKVPPLLHKNRKLCGGGQRWLHSFMLLLHRSLLSVEMTSPASAPWAAASSRNTDNNIRAHPAIGERKSQTQQGNHIQALPGWAVGPQLGDYMAFGPKP